MSDIAIPDEAIEALARILAEQALFEADCDGAGWNAETDSSDHFMPSARKRARRYLEAAAPHILKDLRELVEDMESQPASEIATARGMGGIIRATMKGML